MNGLQALRLQLTDNSRPPEQDFQSCFQKNCNRGDILLSGAVEEERYREYSFRETAKPRFLNSSSAQKQVQDFFCCCTPLKVLHILGDLLMSKPNNQGVTFRR